MEVTKRLKPPVKRAANMVTARVNRPRDFKMLAECTMAGCGRLCLLESVI